MTSADAPRGDDDPTPRPRRAAESVEETDDPAGAPHNDKGQNDKRRRQRTWRDKRLLGLIPLGMIVETVTVLALALLISAVVRAFVGQVYVIPSGSMEDTVHVGDRVVAVKLTDAKRGDIIVFRDPGGWLDTEPHHSSPGQRVLEFVGLRADPSASHLLKRLIGMPGDTVECCDAQGRLSINGHVLEETYLRDGLPAARVPFKVVVPAGRVFVMGDNRNSSRDSRCHLATITNDGQPEGMRAFVPISQIVGPADLRIAPLDRFGQLKRPAIFDGVPAPTQPAPATPVIEPAGVGC